MLTLWPGSYQDREEPFNFDWNAAIEVGPLKLQHEMLRRSASFFNRCYISRSTRAQTWCCSTTSWPASRELRIALMANRVQVRLWTLFQFHIPSYESVCALGAQLVSLVDAGSANPNEKWIDNEAHGGLFGVYMNKDGMPGCSHIRGFFIWRSFDHAIYFQVSQPHSCFCYFEPPLIPLVRLS